MSQAAVQRTHAFWNDAPNGRARAVFAAQGIRCAACSRSIERAVRALPGIDRVDVNVATSRVAVDWNDASTDLPHILAAVEKAGFKPVPLGGEMAEAEFIRERRQALKRIGLAGIGMMQVMMYVLGVYVANPGSIDPAIASYLRYVGMLITAPVLVYSGAPFFQGAWQNLRERTLGMDVPVALALSLAFAASVFNTLRASGQTYFDSVTMFIFFLSAGRYVEMAVRQRSLSLSEAVGRSLPTQVSRVRPDGTTERIALSAVVAGDRLFIPKGGVVPVDVEVLEGEALVDESLVTGESVPERRSAGSFVPGGALNVGSPIRVIARHAASNSTLASIVALLERAQRVRPPVARAADRAANWFVATTLVLAVVVVVGWLIVNPSHAFPAALAVLVVTCPCALSLATPVAVAATATRLARSGLLVTRADALERLANIDTVVLDKTGTLTSDQPTILETTVAPGFSEARALLMAAALERASSHPLAAAFARYASPAVVAADLAEREGQGVSGTIAGESWRLGKLEFVREISPVVHVPAESDGVFLANDAGVQAVFRVGEALRPEAGGAIESFRSLGIEPLIASGDRDEAVARVARAVGINQARSRLTPEQKTEFVRKLQARGARVLMLGDGVNDGPVLALANVSCAMGRGSAIAQAAADFLLLNDSLEAIADAVSTSRQMLRVIRQNLRWALAYNLAAVPLAAFDLVPPWLAAIGMSASSLFVVLNAQRLAKRVAR